MTCKTCGREPENGTETHWLGCEVTAPNRRSLQVAVTFANTCEHEDCSNAKKEWSGRGPRPKYCADGHK